MSYNYKHASNGDISKTKRVLIMQVALNGDTPSCEVVESANSGRFTVYLSSAIGLFYSLPAVGEEWFVEKIGREWALIRKTATQNPAITALLASNPGDVILNASGSIRVISPLIQAPITNTWIKTADSVPTGVVTEIDPPTPVVVDSVATLVGARLKMLYTGTFAIHFMSQTNTTATGRALVEVFAGPYWRRGLFHDEDIANLETTVALNKDDTIRFNVFHSAGSSLLFDHTINITQVR